MWQSKHKLTELGMLSILFKALEDTRAKIDEITPDLPNEAKRPIAFILFSGEERAEKNMKQRCY